MNEEQKNSENEPKAKLDATKPVQLLYKGKPLKVLSTSLGLALMANLFLMPTVSGETTTTDTGEAKLVEWSSEEVKQYFDANMDWNIPIPEEKKEDGSSGEGAAASGGSIGSGGGAPTIYHNGFGWDDLLLYHLLFNNSGTYSSNGWYNRGGIYDARTNRPYQGKKFDSEAFQNKSVVGSSVRPKTTDGSGTITRRSPVNKSTSSSPGGIGGKSSGFSSSSKGSSGGGFGG